MPSSGETCRDTVTNGDQELTSPTTFREAVIILSKKVHRSSKAILKYFNVPEPLSFVTFIKENDTFVYDFLSRVGVRLVVTQERNRQNMLLIDGRFLPDSDFAKRIPLVCWHFDSRGVLVKSGYKISVLPKLHARNCNSKNKPLPLHQLLQLDQTTEDPSTRQDTEDFVKTFAKTNTDIQFYYTAKNASQFCHFIDKCETTISLCAFTKPDYSFGFSLPKPKRVYPKKEKP